MLLCSYVFADHSRNSGQLPALQAWRECGEVCDFSGRPPRSIGPIRGLCPPPLSYSRNITHASNVITCLPPRGSESAWIPRSCDQCPNSTTTSCEEANRRFQFSRRHGFTRRGVPASTQARKTGLGEAFSDKRFHRLRRRYASRRDPTPLQPHCVRTADQLPVSTLGADDIVRTPRTLPDAGTRRVLPVLVRGCNLTEVALDRPFETLELLSTPHDRR